MRSFGIVLLIMVLLFIAGGYFIAFTLQRLEIKCQVKKAIAEGKLSELHQTFLFSLSEFTKLKENDHEFFLEGEMYDIVRTERKGGSILVTCIADREETELLASYIDYYRKIHHDNNPLTPISNSIVDFLQDIVWQPVDNPKNFYEADLIAKIFSRQQFYSSPALAELFRPPDYC